MSKKNILQEPKVNGTPLDPNSKLEVIKNLIFGENIEAYNAEFEALKEDILTKKKEIESLLDEVRDELNKSLDSISTDLNIRITDLENSMEDKLDNLESSSVNRSELGQLLVNLGEKISKQ